MKNHIKILVADSHKDMQTAILRFLGKEEKIQIMGAAESAESAIRMAQELKPDIILIDVNLSGMSGFETAEKIKQVLPDVKVIILSLFCNDQYKKMALKVGAADLINKENIVQELLPAIEKIEKA